MNTSDKSSLLVNVSKITWSEYESVIQSLITSTDIVWINALAFEINSPDLKKKLYSLKEAGLVRIWDYEVSMSKDSGTALDKVLTVDLNKENAAVLDYMMHDVVEHYMGQSSDYTTFNIEKRNMLSNLLTAKFCGAESIIQRNSVKTNVSTGKTDVFQSYVDCIFNETNINTVSGLSVDEILKLRKYSRYFRAKVQKLIDTRLISGEVPSELIRQDCQEISKEYCKEINSRLGVYTTAGTAKGIAMDIASIWLLPVTMLSIGQKIWDEIFNRDKKGFILYLTTLQNSAGVN